MTTVSQPEIKIAWVEFPSGEDTIRGYLATPAVPGHYPALVQVHENLGTSIIART
jgi:carboxymethylenebutenolidase